MFTISKAFIIGAVAVLSTSTVSANELITAEFRYERANSVEANYEAFKRTARRACGSVSTTGGFKAQNGCRKSLVADAVAATKVGSFIAYHQSLDSAVQVASARR